MAFSMALGGFAEAMPVDDILLPAPAEFSEDFTGFPGPLVAPEYSGIPGKLDFSDSANNPAPELTLQTVDGRTIKTTDYLGQVVVLILFTTPACFNGRTTLAGAENSDWVKDPNVKTIVVAQGSLEDVLYDQQQYIPGYKNIELCYTSNIFSILQEMRKAYGAAQENTMYNAENFVIDQTGIVKYYWRGEYKEANYEDAVDDLVNGTVYVHPRYSYLDSIDGGKISFYDYPGKITVTFFVTAEYSYMIDRYMQIYQNAGILSDKDIEFIICIPQYDGSDALLSNLRSRYGGLGAGMEFCQIKSSRFYDPQNGIVDELGTGEYAGAPAMFILGQSTRPYTKVNYSNTDRILEAIQDLKNGVEKYVFPKKLSEPENGEAYNFTVPGINNYGMAYEHLRLLNEYRMANGLNPLEMDKALLEAAMQRAAETAIYFDHTRPDGTSCGTVVTDFGRLWTFSENILAGARTAEAALQSWQNSAGHNANMLNSAHGCVGIGCFTDQRGRTYWVQNFSNPVAVPEDVQSTGSVPVEPKVRATKDFLDIYINAPDMRIKQGESADITVTQRNTGLLGDDTTIGVSYAKSENEGIARVEIVGGKVRVIGVAPGEVNVTVGIMSESGKMMSATGLVLITPPYTMGDVNDSGDITLDDAILVLKKAMNVSFTAGEKFIEQAADIDGKGGITLDDAITVLKMAMNVK